MPPSLARQDRTGSVGRCESDRPRRLLGEVLTGGGHRSLGCVNGYLTLLHSLEQCGLGLGAGPVDLIAEHDVAKNRPRAEYEVGGIAIPDGHSGHVRRQEVGSELDPLESAVDRAGQRFTEQGLADAGHIFNQCMTFSQQSYGNKLDSRPFSLDDGFDIIGGLAELLVEPLQVGGGDRHCDSFLQAPMEQATKYRRRRWMLPLRGIQARGRGNRRRDRYDEAVMTSRTIAAVLRRPSLWLEGLRASAALARPGWYRRPPFLPIPESQYLSWRLYTAYGQSDVAAMPHDVVSYLQWRKRQRSWR
jgi:hypothetical protein